MRILHIGKHLPSSAGGIEGYLGQLMAASDSRGVITHALVHGGGHPARPDPRCTVVPSHGRLLFAPLSPAFLATADRAIADFEPDLLHIHVPNLSALWLLASKAASRVPWLLHWHADVAGASHRLLRVAYRGYAWFESRLLARSAAIVATSANYLGASTTLKPWLHKAHVIPLGLHPPERAPDPESIAWACSQWRPGRGRVLFVGRPSYYKGLSDLLAAVARQPDVSLVVVGPGTAAALAEPVRRQMLHDRVFLLDYQSPDRLSALMGAADCLCLPSTGREEAFGLVALEAMARGTPVVASDIPGSGLSWVVEHGVSGMLVPPSNPAALASVFATLRREPARWQRLGGGARKAFQRRFPFDESVDRMLGLYRGVLATESRIAGQSTACQVRDQRIRPTASSRDQSTR